MSLTCILPAFDSDVAWELGTIIRTRCQENRARPAAIYIAHANSSQLLFFATSRPGTFPDNMHWARRKEAVVLRWGMSSLRMWLQIPELTCTVTRVLSWEEKIKHVHEIADPSVYAFHGGGFPVRVRIVEGIVGVIVVNGLGDDDHGVIVDGIQEYLAKHT